MTQSDRLIFASNRRPANGLVASVMWLGGLIATLAASPLAGRRPEAKIRRSDWVMALPLWRCEQRRTRNVGPSG